MYVCDDWGKQLGNRTEDPFEIGKKRRIVQSPFALHLI
jgi:hypothetical protein